MAVSKTNQTGHSRGPVALLDKWQQKAALLEQIITSDLGGRGIRANQPQSIADHCRGALLAAATHIAQEAASVGIVTGFYVSGPRGPTIETDGPLGALMLAWTLQRLNLRPILFTDALAADPLAETIQRLELDCPLETVPMPERSRSDIAWVEQLMLRGPGSGLSHLISVERAGPGYERIESAGGEPVRNCRGIDISQYTGELHLLFEFVEQNRIPIATIGIGDGGNEIGMGNIPPEVIEASIPNGLGARIACRIRTDWTIAAGVSNWGAYALGSLVAALCDRSEICREWLEDKERAALELLVEAGVVDGLTGKAELTVDGLDAEVQQVQFQTILSIVCE